MISTLIALSLAQATLRVDAPAEKEAWTSCVEDKLLLDDGVSDAIVVGRVIARSCEDELRTFLYATHPNASRGALDEVVADNVNDGTIEAGAVLRHRAKARSAAKSE